MQIGLTRVIPRPYRELVVAVGALLVGAAAGNLLLGAPRDESVVTSRRAIGLTVVARGLESPVDLVSAPASAIASTSSSSRGGSACSRTVSSAASPSSTYGGASAERESKDS